MQNYHRLDLQLDLAQKYNNFLLVHNTSFHKQNKYYQI